MKEKPMEFQRIVLVAALALVAMMLWGAWQKEHQPVVTQAMTSDVGASSTTPAKVNDSATQANSFANQLVQPNQSSEALTPSQSKGEIVTVTTDTQKIKIDTEGGNIVSVELPKYPKSLNTPNEPVTLLSPDPAKLYLAESAMIGNMGPDTLKNKAIYQVANKEFQLANNANALDVTLTWTGNNGVTVKKIYTFHRNDYLIDVKYIISNQSTSEYLARLYAQLTRKDIKVSGGLFRIHPYEGAAISSPEKRYQEISFSNIKSDSLDQTIKSGWAAMVQHYFLSAWVPNADESYRYYTKAWDNDVYTVGFVGSEIKLAPQQTFTTTLKLYSGPELPDRLKEIAPGLSLTVSYGWLAPISVLLFWLLKQCHYLIGNWGWAIVMVTILIKIVFYPLSAKSYHSMANMRKLQPKIESIRERFKEDKQKLSQAMMELYKREKVNPLGGCLPILVQIPVFIALYMVLIESVQLRQAPWILWIKDLAMPDPYFILPVLMGITMFIQQKLNPPPPDPTQAKVLMALPVVFVVLFASFPAGLVLYWFVNNAISILQQWHITRQFNKTPPKHKGTDNKPGKKGDA